MSRSFRSTRLLVLAGLMVLASSACGRTAEPPAPNTSQGVPPDLRGARVMVYPVQDNQGISGDPDAEIAFGLKERGKGVTWILPPELQKALDRSPSLASRTRGLAVGVFNEAEVKRVGDPLYGDLRRLSALVDGEVALIPVRVGPEQVEDGSWAVRMSAALVHIRTGNVLWFGVVQGEPAPPGDPRGLASAVDRLARTLLWYAGG